MFDVLRTRSVFSLFPEDALSGFDFSRYVYEVDEDTDLEPQGVVSDTLLIALDSPLLLFQHNEIEPSCVGSVAQGRSANLYTFLRLLPSQYAVKSKAAGSVLKVPRKVLEKMFARFPLAKTYLLRITEDNSYRHLTKELQALNVSTAFTVQFISQMNRLPIAHHGQIMEVGKVPDGPIFLPNGEFLLRYKSAKKKEWIVPLRSWIGWREALDKQLSNFSVTSLKASSYFQIETDTLNDLAKQFPRDFESLQSWVAEGLFSENHEMEDERDEEQDDPAELFRGSIEIDTPHWRYPFVSQNDEMDCGAACLSMVSQYYGKDLSTQFWRSKLSTNRDGTSLYDLAITSEHFGFVTNCLEVTDLTEVEDYLLPFITLRNHHYLVVYKIEKKSVVVGDPAIGIRKLTFDEFYTNFANAGLFLKPNSEFLTIKESQSPWKHFIYLFQGIKTDILMAFCCGLLSVFLSLAPPVITQVILDEVLINKNYDLLYLLSGLSVAVIFTMLFINWTQSYYFNHIMTKYNFRATTSFIQKMFSLPYHFFATRHVGDFTERISELHHLRAFLTGTLFDASLNILTMIIYGLALFMLSPAVALTVLVLSPFTLAIPLLFSRHMSNIYARLFERRSSQASRLTDYVNGIIDIKSSAAEYACKSRFERELAGVVQAESAFHLASTNVRTVTVGYSQLVSLTVLVLGAYLGAKGELSPGRVVSLTLITSRIFGPLLALTRQWDQFIETKSVVSRLNDIFLSPSEKSGANASRMTGGRTRFKGEIEFRDVWFRYGGEGSEWVLKDVNFKFDAGDRIAIVGPSGSGKSTIAYLLSRMYEPTKGNIFIDGRDYREFDIDFLRSQIGLLPQESTLFYGTVAENIALHKLDLDIDMDKATQAADRASALSLILDKVGGFEHPIPHGGYGFSVGEKQRIALARLFYNDPALIVLDEATSSLDGISERKIMECIEHEMSERTVINIAHRFSTVAYSDLILVMNGGRVSGFGTLEYLMKNNVIFQGLFSSAWAQESDPVRSAS